MKECMLCMTQIVDENYDAHYNECYKEQLKQYAIFEDKLSPLQEKAIEYFKKKAKIMNKSIKLQTLAKFYFNGYTEEQMETTLDYIKNKMPIVIHVKMETVGHLAKDTHYRNMFERNSSKYAFSANACPRIEWEKNLFNGIYDQSTAFEKVKYGAINILNNPSGVFLAHGYGDSYLLLKQNVKERTSFVFGDSSSKQTHMCSFDCCSQILYYVEDAMFHEIVKVANKLIPHSDYKYPYYIEMQIHGAINLSKDVECLVINDAHKIDKTIINIADNFRNRHNVSYKFMT